ncbi:MAG: sodium-dependent transporter [Planctomycetes bacterium]|nr:sodium-dependent transporter [Planctomycetota bacterium]
MSSERGTWGSQWGFILAAIGSAIGLGNIWRFPYLAYTYGGAVFLIPYLLALVVVGLPLLMLEFGIGHHMRASAPLAFRKIGRNFGWLGWWAVTFVMFGIVIYYAVVIAWCVDYLVLSFGKLWGADPSTFFDQKFLKLTTPGPVPGEEFKFGGMAWWVLIGLAVVWAANWVITVRDVQKGIEKANRIFMPLLLGITAFLVFWSLVFFDGAWKGVGLYLWPGKEDWAKLGDPTIWTAAFGQIFFSLSVGFGIMIAYASYLPRDAKVTRGAVLTALGNSGFSMFAALAVFATIGFVANSYGVGVRELETTRIVRLKNDAAGDRLKARMPEVLAGKLSIGVPESRAAEVAAEAGIDGDSFAAGTEKMPVKLAGPGLVFKTYPITLNQIPGGSVFGILFFAALIVAGLSSSVSIIEAFSSALTDHFKITRGQAATGLCAVAFLGGIPFATGSGLHLLSVVDHFLNSYGLITVGIMESIIVGWFFTARKLRSHIGEARDMRISHIADVGMRAALSAVLALTWYGLAKSAQSAGTAHQVGSTIAMLLVLGTIFLLWLDEHWLDFDVKFIIPALLLFILNNSLVEEFRTQDNGGYFEGYKAGFVMIGVFWIIITVLIALVMEQVSTWRQRHPQMKDLLSGSTSPDETAGTEHQEEGEH